MYLAQLFDTADFPPRWTCGSWTPLHGWTHVIADATIFSSYVAIPAIIAWYMRHRRLSFPIVGWMFFAFIFFCGLGHLIEAIIFWHPLYRLSAVVKVCTAVASVGTTLILVRLAPLALALPETVTELTRSNDELDLFMSAASHDLREPLRGIQLQMQLLQELHAPDLPGPVRERLERVGGLATRAERLVDGLLEVARLGSSDQATRAIDLDALLGDVVELIEATRGSAVDVEVVDELPRAQGEYSSLVSVFRNLIENGLRYNESSSPRIEIAHVQGGPKSPGEVTISVRDNGVGIPTERIDLVFEPFRRLHPGQADGRGLGLTIVKRTVELAGGRIRVESEVGSGSTFYVTLPAA